jgi:hypothetical protein
VLRRKWCWSTQVRAPIVARNETVGANKIYHSCGHQLDGHVASSPQWQDHQRQGRYQTIPVGRSSTLSSSMAPRSCAFPLPPSPHIAVNTSGSRFDKDNMQQDMNLDEMDLDDILNRAEDHETVTGGGGGAPLGSEGFLASVAFVSDVRGLSVKRINGRPKSSQRLDTKDGKRSHALVSYERWTWISSHRYLPARSQRGRLQPERVRVRKQWSSKNVPVFSSAACRNGVTSVNVTTLLYALMVCGNAHPLSSPSTGHGRQAPGQKQGKNKLRWPLERP